MKLTFPELCLVVLVGTSGSGKSTFAARHFKETEVLSSDYCRAIVCDDETDQSATVDAFEVLHYIAAKRLERGKIAVIDATNVQPEARKPLVRLARDHDLFAVAIVLDMPERLCKERNQTREDRDFGGHVIRRQRQQLKKHLKGLKREGFRFVYTIDDPNLLEQVTIERTRLWPDRREESGPFDIIGDIHGCYDELVTLLTTLGYRVQSDNGKARVSTPPGRRAVFLGDLVDRGPGSTEVLRLVMSMVEEGTALCVPGNHDVKLMKKLRGRNVKISHGLAETLEQLEGESEEFRAAIADFIDSLVSHFVLDDGKLVVSHAGMKAQYQGRASARVRQFALYGDTTGETDEYGLPVRYDWAREYRGRAMVVYGHTPVADAEWVNGTINIDTGCVFGGSLTALRYPEKELVSVKSSKMYYEPLKPLQGSEDDAREGDVLDIRDVSGKRILSTRLMRSITIREDNAAAALESMSRFAVAPQWLIYLPPTMSPAETSNLDGYLEHPREAFEYYSSRGVERVVCQEKHMGSRAIVIVCENEEAGRRRFGAPGKGACYTRTGRPFFTDPELEKAFLAELSGSLSAAAFWDQSDWLLLDCELLPWSQKAQELLKSQYAAVGAAADAGLSMARRSLLEAAERGVDVESLMSRYEERAENARLYVDAYRQYCWPVERLSDLRLAPFHVLASEGGCNIDRDHSWHMSQIDAFMKECALYQPTRRIELDLTRESDVEKGIAWWLELTAAGGEGMVVKPSDFVVKGHRGLLQPAIKCRGREYLRIIYGPDYTMPEHLSRLRERGLSRKRGLALKEFALGVEALERFVDNQALYRVHECVFGVLAMESEPVDARL